MTVMRFRRRLPPWPGGPAGASGPAGVVGTGTARARTARAGIPRIGAGEAGVVGEVRVGARGTRVAAAGETGMVGEAWIGVTPARSGARGAWVAAAGEAGVVGDLVVRAWPARAGRTKVGCGRCAVVSGAALRRGITTASPAVAKRTIAPPTTTALPVPAGPGVKCVAAPLPAGAEGRCDAGAVADRLTLGSRPNRTPGPDASAGSCRIQPGSIMRGFSSRLPSGWSRPLFNVKISRYRWVSPSVLAAIPYRATACPFLGCGTM